MKTASNLTVGYMKAPNRTVPFTWYDFKNRNSPRRRFSYFSNRPEPQRRIYHSTEPHRGVYKVRKPPQAADQGYGRGGTPVFTSVFEPLARVALYLMDENGLGTCFWGSLHYLCIAD